MWIHRTGERLPPNTPGKLCLRKGSLMMGFHRKERADVFDADGYYHTDDICTIDEDGHLYLIGRQSEMVKIKGANVSPPEVERAMRTISGVMDVTVVGIVQDNQEETLAAAVIRSPDANLTEGDLRAQLKTLVASYKVPNHFVFVEQHEIPLTAGSKVYKPGVKELLMKKLAG